MEATTPFGKLPFTYKTSRNHGIVPGQTIPFYSKACNRTELFIISW